MIIGGTAANHLATPQAGRFRQSGGAMRLSAAFIATCMVVIAASLAATAYLVLGFTGVEAAATALTVLAVLAAYNLFSGRGHEDAGLGRQISDLSVGTAQLAVQVGELGRRMVAVETAVVDAAAGVRTAAAPLAGEIEELGTLVNQLAESVAAHELALVSAALPSPGGGGSASAQGASRGRVDMQGHAPPAPADRSPYPDGAERQSERSATLPFSAGGDAAPPQPATLPEAAQLDPALGGRFDGMARDEIVALIRAALAANRVDLYLQPIVTLPQRKVRHYEVSMRLRIEGGAIVTPADFLGYARDGGLMPMLDTAMLLRAAQVVRRLSARSSEIGLFCNIAAATLADAAAFAQVADFLAANRSFASFLTFGLAQDALRALGRAERSNLMQLAGYGFRFSMDGVGDLAIEPRALADQGFRFARVPATLILGHAGAAAGDIHPADLGNLLGRYGIDLIADRIESEGTVADLLDYDVRFGQGPLFGAPRPVRAEVFQGAPERPPQARLDEVPIPPEAKPVEIATGAPIRRREPAEPAGQAAPARTPSGLSRLARDMMRRA
jgi:cyclic-di-GMP phosphodiesterase, flagellum assembly factor TipF